MTEYGTQNDTELLRDLEVVLPPENYKTVAAWLDAYLQDPYETPQYTELQKERDELEEYNIHLGGLVDEIAAERDKFASELEDLNLAMENCQCMT